MRFIDVKRAFLYVNIEDFVEFDADVLRNSCFVKQKELEGYFDEGLSKRKKIVGKLLNLEKLSIIEESYKKEFKNKDLIKEYYQNRLIIEVKTEDHELNFYWKM